MKKVELVFIPLPATGHLVPMMELVKLLINRDEQLSVTVLVLKLPFDAKAYSFFESLAADTTSSIRFVDIPQAQAEAFSQLISPEVSSEQMNPLSMLSKLLDSQKPYIRDAVAEITQSGSARLAGFVIDMFCTTLIDVLSELGVPTYIFYTSPAAALGLRIHVQNLVDNCNQDVTEYKDSEIELLVPTYSNPVPAKLLPSSFFGKEGMILNSTRRLRETKGIMINTFQDLEFHAMNALASEKQIPSIYPIGPLINIKGIDSGNQEVDTVSKWLDDQPTSSVVFLCFGSMGSFEKDQVKEIANALEQGGHRFLWSLRQPPTKGHLGYPGEYKDIEHVLPEGFLQRTGTTGLGKVIGWAPQVQVLGHPAVGGFVTHCGWNSVLESVCSGVPMAVWPMYAEQQMNAFELVKDIGIAVEIKMDYRKDIFTTNSSVIVKSYQIEDGIRKLMEPQSEIRNKVKEMKEKSRTSLMEGGSSYISLGNLIEEFHVVS